MVLRVDVVAAALEAAYGDELPGPVIALTPKGRPLTQAVVEELVAEPKLTLLSARFDERQAPRLEGGQGRRILIMHVNAKACLRKGEDQLAGRRSIRAGADDEDRPRVCKPRGDRLGAGFIAAAARQQRADIAGVERPRGEVRPDSGRRDQRRDIADRVAPAVIELDRLDDGFGQLRAR